MKKHRVRANNVARVVRKIVSAMINHCFESPDSPKYCRLPIIEAGYSEADGKAYHVYWYRLQWMIVESAVSKWDVYFMMHRMDVLCQLMSTFL